MAIWLEANPAFSWERFRPVPAGVWRPAAGAPQEHAHFERIRGRLIGPGSYGHLGASTYVLRADSLLEVRTPAAGDCAEASVRPRR